MQIRNIIDEQVANYCGLYDTATLESEIKSFLIKAIEQARKEGYKEGISEGYDIARNYFNTPEMKKFVNEHEEAIRKEERALLREWAEKEKTIIFEGIGYQKNPQLAAKALLNDLLIYLNK